MTRAGIEHGTASVLAVVAAGHEFERYHLLLAHAALAVRALLNCPELYSDAELGEFVRYGARGVELLRDEPSKEGQAARRLLAAQGRLAAEALAWRTAPGHRGC